MEVAVEMERGGGVAREDLGTAQRESQEEWMVKYYCF